MDKYDLVVIGGGPGGYPAAIRAAQLGAKVALVEREALGGTCLNWGCIPTKTLIASAEFAAQVGEAAAQGIQVDGYRADYAAMAAYKNKVVSQLRTGIQSLLKTNGITLLNGSAGFAARDQIEFSSDSGTVRIGAERTILATGSTAFIPNVFPRHTRVLDSRAFLTLDSLPESMIVVGGGYIGCEMACLAAQLGVRVVLIEMLDTILPQLDGDLRQVVQQHMEKKLRIQILTGQRVEQPVADESGVRCRAGSEEFQADALLVTIGRRPVTEGLALERAGLSTTPQGHIEVDAQQRTRQATIYATGDVTGGLQFAYVATSQAWIAAESACGQKPRANETVVPGVMFTAPEVALAGLTESAAREQKREIRVGTFPFRALGRALSIRQSEGFVKWIADADTGQLLGAAVVGAHASDLIAEAVLAIRHELTAAEVGATLHAHPTFSEAWMEAAHAVQGTCVHLPPPKRARK